MQQKFPFLEQVRAAKKILLNNFLSSFKWSKLLFYRISMAINISNPLQHLFLQCTQYEHQLEIDNATSNFRVGMLIHCHSFYFVTRFCTNLFRSGHKNISFWSLILNLFKWSCWCYLFNRYILYKSYQIWSENSLKIGPKICCLFKNLVNKNFMFTAFHSADKFLNEQQILELMFDPKFAS